MTIVDASPVLAIERAQKWRAAPLGRLVRGGAGYIVPPAGAAMNPGPDGTCGGRSVSPLSLMPRAKGVSLAIRG